MRDHLILNAQTQLLINRLHLIHCAEERGLSTPAPFTGAGPQHNAAIVEMTGLKSAPAGGVSWEEMNRASTNRLERPVIRRSADESANIRFKTRNSSRPLTTEAGRQDGHVTQGAGATLEVDSPRPRVT